MPNGQLSLGKIYQALADAGDPWEAGVTSLSSLSLDEQKMHLGVSPPPGEPTADEIDQRWPSIEQSLKSEAIAAVAAPSSYDLRNVNGKNFITPVRDQKKLRLLRCVRNSGDGGRQTPGSTQ